MFGIYQIERLLVVLGVGATCGILSGCSSARSAPLVSVTLKDPIRDFGSEGAVSARVFRYQYGSSSGQVWVASIRPEGSDIGVIPSGRPIALRRLVRKFPYRSFVAINGGFYDRGQPMGLTVSKGTITTPLSKGGGSGVFYVANKRVDIVHRTAFEMSDQITAAVQSIDRLVDQGKVLVVNRRGLGNDARSAVGVRADGTLVFVALFDDRAVLSATEETVVLNARSSSTGPTLYEFAEFLARPESSRGLGLVKALNLDGGYSTSMVIQMGGKVAEVVAHGATINALWVRPRL